MGYMAAGAGGGNLGFRALGTRDPCRKDDAAIV